MTDHGEPWKVWNNSHIEDRDRRLVILGKKWVDCFDGDEEPCNPGVLEHIVQCVNQAAAKREK